MLHEISKDILEPKTFATPLLPFKRPQPGRFFIADVVGGCIQICASHRPSDVGQKLWTCFCFISLNQNPKLISPRNVKPNGTWPELANAAAWSLAGALILGGTSEARGSSGVFTGKTVHPTIPHGRDAWQAREVQTNRFLQLHRIGKGELTKRNCPPGASGGFVCLCLFCQTCIGCMFHIRCLLSGVHSLTMRYPSLTHPQHLKEHCSAGIIFPTKCLPDGRGRRCHESDWKA